ncbi:hypothetical protein JW979_09070, partial [bacterium]|nr:hypothetical protein [candidate division CSSED10-310 bacterium]
QFVDKLINTGKQQVCYLAPDAFLRQNSEPPRESVDPNIIILKEEMEIALFKKTRFVWEDGDIYSKEEYSFPAYYYSTGQGTVAFYLQLKETEDDKRMVSQLSEMEKRYRSMNAFEQRNNPDLINSINSLKDRLQLNLDRRISNVPHHMNTLYFSDDPVKVTDTDYMFDSEILRVKIPPNFLTIDRDSAFFWDKKNEHIKEKIRLQFVYSEFMIDRIRYQNSELHIPMEPGVASALFNGGKEADIRLRLYYSIECRGDIGEFRIKDYTNCQDKYKWAIYPMLKVKAIRVYNPVTSSLISEFGVR